MYDDRSSSSDATPDDGTTFRSWCIGDGASGAGAELPRVFTHARIEPEVFEVLVDTFPSIEEILAAPLADLNLWRPSCERVQNRTFPDSRQEVLDTYAQGGSVKLQPAERHFPALRPFCELLRQELAAFEPIVDCVAIVSSCASIGAVPHYDPMHVFGLQLAGSKVWRVPDREHRLRFAPGVGGSAETPISLDELYLDGAPPLEDPRLDRTVTLRAGAGYFLPIGTPHATGASEASYSLCFGVRPRCAMRQLDRLLSVAYAREARMDACVAQPDEAYLGESLRLLERAIAQLAGGATAVPDAPGVVRSDTALDGARTCTVAALDGGRLRLAEVRLVAGPVPSRLAQALPDELARLCEADVTIELPARRALEIIERLG